MGSVFLEMQLPIEYSSDDIDRQIKKSLKISEFEYKIDLKSTDARKKNNIHWQIRVLVNSPEIAKTVVPVVEQLQIPYSVRKQKIVIVGFGPAAYFAADILSQAGYSVTIIERGADADKRAKSIRQFESNDEMNLFGNYVYGEGGAGTFSDGKLTSRTKGISSLKQYVLETFVQAGAPEEILYLSKPHIGSNNLRKMMPVLRQQLLNRGVSILFEQTVKQIHSISGKSWKVYMESGDIDADILIFAAGHSAFDTYRLLLQSGVHFKTKPFALGVRVEHSQELINKAQWNRPYIKGLKAAEYVLKWQGSNGDAAYSFCMCPGGKIVQSAPQKGQNIVNGMSYYSRNSPYANSAIVVPFELSKHLQREVSPDEMLDWLELLEQRVWNMSHSFAVPANTIRDFIGHKLSQKIPSHSYSHGVYPFEFREIFEESIINQLVNGMQDFGKKIRGFEDGVMMGLESKTSSSIQVLRCSEHMHTLKYPNLYVIGEGSGYAGGIMSSAVDGIKSAFSIFKRV